MRDIFRGILPDNHIKENESFSHHTTFQIGGPADLMLWPETTGDLANILSLCHEHQLPAFILGNGSNLLVSDLGMSGVVVHMGLLNQIERKGNHLICGAGVELKDLAAFAQEEGLAGLEFASGIPGSVGGAIYMNAGAYDGEIKDVVFQVMLLDYSGKPHMFSAEEMAFSYRHSRLKDEPYVCVAAEFALKTDTPENVGARVADLTERRASRQPLEWPSAGSTFKRPVGYYAGPLIIEAGMQGARVGGAEVSTKHAGFIINRGGATARDVLMLIDKVQKAVYEKSGVRLEPEVRMVGRPM